MADLVNISLAVAAVRTTGLDSLTEHGQIKVLADGEYLLEIADGDSGWIGIYQGRDPIMVFDYVGTVARITNKDDEAIRLRVGQV